MAEPHFLDVLYSRASTLLRDLFHYTIAVLVLLVLVIAPMAYRLGYDEAITRTTRIGSVFSESALFALMLMAVALAVTYGVGHVLMGISRVLFWVYSGVWARVGRRGPAPWDVERDWLKSEMTVYIALPDVHGQFIERTNTMFYLRKSITTSLAVVAVFYCFSFDGWSRIFAVTSLLILSGVMYDYSRRSFGKFLEGVELAAVMPDARADRG